MTKVVSKGEIKVTLVANVVRADDGKGKKLEVVSWNFVPDKVSLAYSGDKNVDKVTWVLNAVDSQGYSISGVQFAKTNGIFVKNNWPFNQPKRFDGGMKYKMEFNNTESEEKDYGFSATALYNGEEYASPDPEIVLEPGS